MHRSLGVGASVPGVGDGEEGIYDQGDGFASPKPGTRAYRERERREMVAEREDRQRERKTNGGLSVKKTFEVVEEGGDIGRGKSS